MRIYGWICEGCGLYIPRLGSFRACGHLSLNADDACNVCPPKTAPRLSETKVMRGEIGEDSR